MTRHRLVLMVLALSGVAAMAAASGAQARVGTAGAPKQHAVAKSSTATGTDPTCVIHSLRRFREAGEFGNHSSVADVITVECHPVLAENTVTISSDELSSRCAGTLSWYSATANGGTASGTGVGPSFDVILDNDGQATVVVWEGLRALRGPASSRRI